MTGVALLAAQQSSTAGPPPAGFVVGFFLLWAFVMLLGIGGLVLTIIAIVDMARRPDWQWRLAGSEKVLWIVLAVLVNFLGIVSLIYWFSVRKRLIAVENDAAEGRLGPGVMTASGWAPGPGAWTQGAPGAWTQGAPGAWTQGAPGAWTQGAPGPWTQGAPGAWPQASVTPPWPQGAPGGWPPGWYPDAGRQDHERFWNGTQWTEHTRAAIAPGDARTETGEGAMSSPAAP